MISVDDMRKILDKISENGHGDHELRVHERGSIYDWGVKGAHKSNKKYDIDNNTKVVLIT